MTRVAERAAAILALIAGLVLLSACRGEAESIVPGGDPARGAQAITRYGCPACHTIPGIRNADGVVGPPLFSWADRTYIAGLLHNDPGNLMRWVQDPQSILPGVAMPDMGVTDEDARDIAAYLFTLRRDRSPVQPDEATVPRDFFGGGRSEDQPVPFNHEWHAGDLDIDCRYCHTTVETSSYAGVPATEICVNCHAHLRAYEDLLAPVHDSYRTGEPIAWRRVNNLADFSYFDHSAHLNKGVPCVDCHGQVDQMPKIQRPYPLSMSWCLDCHREPEKHVRPREFVFVMDWEPSPDQLTVGRQIVEEYGIEEKTSCSICHR
ncbi:MAG: c-type cytochrome [Anaerolineae bacterium]